MANRKNALSLPARNCPCNDCPERFLACSDRCPKDARGEHGYKAWHDDIDKIKANRRAYLNLPFSKIT